MTTYYVRADRKRMGFFARLFGAVDIEDGVSFETAFRDINKAIAACESKEDSVTAV